MDKPTDEEKPEQENYLDRLIKKHGLKVKKVELPKDWVRIYTPPNNRQEY